ncbi:hypothetical protein KUH03_03000 [Sphingobacterium sp. E70]|uniref:hypothetical protein n=1 Tax=Sphingobacterium sp. E70 TaxID=2853439 RepID=UPI00211C9A7A|nr:hypothetical protein [Sphingobacterium sp. E70]ULT25961.1 hypothetical protein KUH03_03000 [Sphingobacterium sp. E70]
MVLDKNDNLLRIVSRLMIYLQKGKTAGFGFFTLIDRSNFELLKIIVMENIVSRLLARDWTVITRELHDKGFVIVPDLLNQVECDELVAAYGVDNRYRKTIVMERYRFGLGNINTFNIPCPS